MSPTILADSIVNLCGAIGLIVALLIFRARDPHGALTRRFTLALGLVAVVFLLRGVAWITQSVPLDRLSVAFAAIIPLAALMVIEGMLRRHAPRLLKLAMLIGSVVLAILALVAPAWIGIHLYAALAGFQLLGFAACGLILVTYPRGSLTDAEARSVVRLCLAAFFLLPFIVTDFRSLFPHVPVRAGALGALLVVTFALIADAASDTRIGHVVMLGLRIATGLLLGLVAALMVPGAGAADIARLCAVTVSGALVTGLLVEATRAWFVARRPGLLGSVAASGAQTRDALVDDLLRQTLFGNARRLTESQLLEFDPPILRAGLKDKLVIRRADHPWGLPAEDPVAERLVALMATHDASHLLILDTDQLDLIAVNVPLVLADRATETGLLLSSRLLAATPRGTAS